MIFVWLDGYVVKNHIAETYTMKVITIIWGDKNRVNRQHEELMLMNIRPIINIDTNVFLKMINGSIF